MIVLTYLLAVAIGYLIGSIPFGLIISMRSTKIDIRQVGSGKMGTTNVLRTAGKKAAVLVLLLDLSKGAVAVLVATLIFGKQQIALGGSEHWLTPSAQVLAALAAIVGHTWPVFVRFKGGRGVATFLGGLIVLCPPAALFGGEILIIGAGLTRYMSLGSIAGAVGTFAILVPLTMLNGFPVEYLFYSAAGTIFIIVMHRDNISRLLSGTERKIGEKIETRTSTSTPEPR